MLDEEKIRMMADLAMFEKKAGKEMAPAGKYFKGDYISSRMIRSLLMYLLVSALIAVFWLILNFEEAASMLTQPGLWGEAWIYAACFAAGLAIYLAITWYVYSARYKKAVRNFRAYQHKLRRLQEAGETR